MIIEIIIIWERESKSLQNSSKPEKEGGIRVSILKILFVLCQIYKPNLEN